MTSTTVSLPKWLLVSAALAAGVVQAAAAPPPTLTGCTYEEMADLAYPPGNYQRTYWMADAETARPMIFWFPTRGEALFQDPLPPDSAYVYRVTGDNTAELRLGTATRFLTFETDERGTWSENDDVRGTFRIARPNPQAVLVNASNRATIGPTQTAITGFVHAGERPHWFLIRVIGPSLAGFGVDQPAADPRLMVHLGPGFTVGNENWEHTLPYLSPPAESVRRAAALVGAFPLEPGSRDAALLIRLAPGAHTVEALPEGGGTDGVVLTEVYALP